METPHIEKRLAVAAPRRSASATLWVSSVDTPIGALRAVSSDDALIFLGLAHANGAGLHGFLTNHFPGAKRAPGSDRHAELAAELGEYFKGTRRTFSIPIALHGTEFQERVWTALQRIPYGSTCSYGELAMTLQCPRAARAVGAANGANPLPLIVPCHRVVAAGGRIGGYAGGIDLKKRLLAMERAGVAADAESAELL